MIVGMFGSLHYLLAAEQMGTSLTQAILVHDRVTICLQKFIQHCMPVLKIHFRFCNRGISEVQVHAQAQAGPAEKIDVPRIYNCIVLGGVYIIRQAWGLSFGGR